MTSPAYESWLTSKRFWTDTIERVVRTTAQVALAVLGTPLVADALPADVAVPTDWQTGALTVAMAAVLTFLTCLAGRATGDRSTASLTSGTAPSPEVAAHTAGGAHATPRR